jgi:predicted nucleotidyltransferase
LFGKLVEEINSIRQQSKQFRVFVFGSYLRGKRNPGDVDVLLSYEPASFPPRLKRIHPNDIQIMSNARTAIGHPAVLDSKKDIIRDFNKSPDNLRKGIALLPWQVRELVVCG